jgi:hypothetical protein
MDSIQTPNQDLFLLNVGGSINVLGRDAIRPTAAEAGAGRQVRTMVACALPIR